MSPETMSAPQAVVSEEERARVHRRTLTVVIASQVLGGAGLAAGIAVGALLAQDMLGSDGLSGLPTGLFTLGSALAAFLVGRSTRAFGRRRGWHRSPARRALQLAPLTATCRYCRKR